MRGKFISRGAGALVLAGAVLAIGAPSALATSSLTPSTAQDFGSQTVGTASAPKVFVVQVTCTTTLMGTCIIPGVQPVAPTATTDFTATTNCPTVVVNANFSGIIGCTVNVTFKPSAPGARNGILTVGAGLPTVSLTGNGVAAPLVCKKGQKLKNGKCVKKKKKKKKR